MSSALPLARGYHRWVIDLFRPRLKGRLLEVGFGYGQYTREIARSVDEVIALDLNADGLSRDARFPRNVRLLISDILNPALADHERGRGFDAVLCLNVLEHIRDDGLALRNIFRLLRPGGALLVLVPAHRRLYGRMDALAGHERRYSRRELREKLIGAGFQVEKLYFFNAQGGIGWWLNTRLFRPRVLSSRFINLQIRLFDAVLLPISKAANPMTRHFFGQSLWGVAVRPAFSEAAP